jgi:hypothetical protein
MATDWRRIELSREQISAGELENIRAQFSLFMMTNEPAGDIAVFTRSGKLGSCEVYFPPVALRYAEFVFERHPPCASSSPALLGTTLLAGSHAAVASLLGKSYDVLSFRKMLEPAADVSSTFLQAAQPEGYSR